MSLWASNQQQLEHKCLSSVYQTAVLHNTVINEHKLKHSCTVSEVTNAVFLECGLPQVHKTKNTINH